MPLLAWHGSKGELAWCNFKQASAGHACSSLLVLSPERGELSKTLLTSCCLFCFDCLKVDLMNEHE